MTKSYYHACHQCTAKWFGASSSMICPRCGHCSQSKEQITPPWDLKAKETLNMKKRKSITGIIGFLIGLFVASFIHLFLSESWLLTNVLAAGKAITFYLTGVVFDSVTDYFKSLFDTLWNLMP